MLSAVFINIANQNLGPLWTPPFTPLVSSSVTAIASLLALGILFALPGIASSIKEALKAKPAIPVGFGGIAAPLGQAGGIGFQLFQFYHAMEQTKLLRKAAGGGKEGGSSE